MKKSSVVSITLLLLAAGGVNVVDGNSLPDIVLLLLNGPPRYSGPPLNDTGITWGGNYPDGNNSDCSGVEVSGQDCSHGRDITQNHPGDGHGGFSLTKLDSNGDPLANQGADYSTAPWACVRDNITGLIWEVKTDDGGLHARDDGYSWYNTDPTTNGGTEGYADAGGATCHGYDSGDAATFCNTQAFVARVNAAGWCGASDWRMPSRKELQGIVSYGRFYPAIDKDFFPNTTNTYYWTGSLYAYFSFCTWNVSFSYGGSYYSTHNMIRQVRLVRSKQ